MDLNPISMIFGVISFFVSMIMLQVFNPIITTLFSMFSDGFLKTALYIMTYMMFFAVIFMVPYSVYFSWKKKREDV